MESIYKMQLEVTLQKMINIQEKQAPKDYDAYAHGLNNGLKLAMCVIKGEGPRFRDRALAEFIIKHNLKPYI